MQPVRGPHLPVVRLWRTGSVEVQGAESQGDGIEHRVDLLCSPGQRPRECARQAEHPAGIWQAHGEHLRSRRPECAHRVRGSGFNQVGIEAWPERVVDSEYHAGDIRAQSQGARQLITLDVRYAGAARGEDVQIRIDEAVGEQRSPATPGAALRIRTDGIADAQGDRVAEGYIRGHARTPALAAVMP